MNSMFYKCIKLTSLNLTSFQTDRIVNMKNMFKRCLSLKSLDLSNFITSKVTNMEGIFSECVSLNELNINNFDVKSVETMAYMFSGCKLLISIIFPDFSNLKVENISHMFYDCSSLNSLDLYNFDSSHVKCMDYMFSDCRFLTSLNISNLKTETVTNMEYIFSDCSSLRQINLDSFNTENVVYMNGMFHGCILLEELKISHFITSSVEKMSFMFYHMKSIKSLNIPNFNTAKVEYMNYMFEGCNSLTYLDISHFDVSKIKNFDAMFSGCSKLLRLDISNFVTTNAITMNDMFNGCISLKFLDISKFDTSQTTSFKNMFFGCKLLTSLDVSKFKTDLITSMEYLFYGCSSLKEISLSNFDTSSVTTFEHMFDGCSNLTSIDLRNFETTKVKSMAYMFYGCSSLTNIYINNFITTSLENMGHMFEKCSLLREIDLSSFDTNLVENMDNIFSEDYNLVRVNFEKYDETHMLRMDNIFYGTLENMVLCFDESKSDKLYKIVKGKGCSEIDCSSDWIKSRKKIINDTNECVDQCPEGILFFYDSKCFKRCPDGTYPDNYVCIKSSEDKYTEGQVCDIKNYFLHNCRMNLQTHKEKIRFIENTVNGIIHSDLYTLVLMAIEGNQNLVIKEETETYQIYALSNKKNRDQNLTYIDFGDCIKLLRESNKIVEKDDILIFKIEYTHPDFKIPIIEYALFGVYGTKRLNLLTCNDIKMKYYIPKEIKNYKDYRYNPNNNYYKDKCYPSFSDNMLDLTVRDRIEIFNDKNMSLCESICTYKGYEYEYKSIICECSIKQKFNSFLNVNASKYNLIYRFENAELNVLNFWVLKCLFNTFTKDVIIKNICSMIILVIIFAVFVSIIIFCIKEHGIIEKKIIKLFEITLQKEENNNSMDNSKTICFENGGSDKNEFNNSINNNKNTSKKNIDLIQQGNNSIIYQNNIDKNKIAKLKEMKEYGGYTDNELNYMQYFDALLEDKRSFFQIYFSLIKTKHLLVFAFGCKNDYNPRTMKISFMLFIFVIFLTANTIFVNDTALHKLFVSNGKREILNDIYKIGLSALISSTIKNLLLLVAFPENDILEIKKIEIENNDKRNQDVQGVKTIVMIRCYIYFFANIIILSLIWIYISSFFMIFQKTQIYVIQNTLISFGISMAAPFILYFIPTFIKKLAMKGEGSQGRYCLYLLATILQVLL